MNFLLYCRDDLPTTTNWSTNEQYTFSNPGSSRNQPGQSVIISKNKNPKAPKIFIYLCKRKTSRHCTQIYPVTYNLWPYDLILNVFIWVPKLKYDSPSDEYERTWTLKPSRAMSRRQYYHTLNALNYNIVSMILFEDCTTSTRIVGKLPRKL